MTTLLAAMQTNDAHTENGMATNSNNESETNDTIPDNAFLIVAGNFDQAQLGQIQETSLRAIALERIFKDF